MMAGASREILVTREISHDGTIWIIKINRPKAKNAVDGPTAVQLHAAFVDFENDPTALVAVLAGVGDTFCAGADLKSVASGKNINPLLPVDGSAVAPMGPSRLELSKPVIAAIQGHAVAGGLELAAWADMRVAEADSTLGVFCRRWGVPLIDGGSVRLPSLIGASRASDLILTGRPVSAQEALEMGLINRIAPVGHSLTMAVELAASLVTFPQNCLRADLASSKCAPYAVSQQAALADEFTGGTAVLQQAKAGAGQFAEGAGRGGDFSAFQQPGHDNALKPKLQPSTDKQPLKPQAVVFDLGGVVLDSPFAGIAALEQRLGVPAHSINRTIAAAGSKGPFQRLERGEIDAQEFGALFEEEMDKLGGAAGQLVSGTQLLQSITQGLHLRPGMLTALHCLRLAGFKTAICTNNFYDAHGMMDSIMGALIPLVDNVFESCKLGIRKPEPAMFSHVTSELRLAPEQIVFLDDIGSNLKAASQHGWHTIKVHQNDMGGSQALQQLSELLQLPLAPPAHTIMQATRSRAMHNAMLGARSFSTASRVQNGVRAALRTLAKL